MQCFSLHIVRGGDKMLGVWEEIQNTKTNKDVIDIIDRIGPGGFAQKLLELEKLPVPDKDEPISLESLKGFADFLLTIPTCPKPTMTISPDGLLNVEWDNEPDSLAIEFLNAADVQFAALFNSDSKPHATSGKVTLNKLLTIHISLLDYFLQKNRFN